MVYALPGEPRVEGLAVALGARRVGRGRDLLLPRPDVVFVCLPASRLRRAAVAATLARARAVVCVALGAPPAPEAWTRRFHRIVVSSQEEASAWKAAGYALGRLVVLPAWEPDVLGALVAEVVSMAR